MSVLGQTRFIERLQFFNGQRLFASDLQGLEAFNREMRWLHNRSLHQPGVGAGFAVYGGKGARQVQIGPGYALDAAGREIVLTDSQPEPVPPVAGNNDGTPVVYYLTISYPDDQLLEEAETRDGICVPAGAVRLRERPVICWIRLEHDAEKNRDIVPAPFAQEILDGRRIVLGEAKVQDCQLFEPFCVAPRRSARPSVLPRIVCRCECYSAAELKALVQGDQVNGLTFTGDTDDIVSFTAHVDTQLDDLCTTPCYLVRVSVPPSLIRYWSTVASITATKDGFDADVAMGSIIPTDPSVADAIAHITNDHEKLCIDWIAIES